MQAKIADLEQALEHAKVAANERGYEAKMAKDELDRVRGTEKLIDAVSTLTQQVSTSGTPRWVSTGARLERFRGRPVSKDDMTVYDWTRDMQARLSSLKCSDQEKTSIILEHLSGNARNEIIGRGGGTSLVDPMQILSILQSTFGDGDTLPQLQQRFFSFKQSGNDLISCSLELVDVYDRMVILEPSYKQRRDITLKERFAECVTDESLRRELRRLNIDQPDLSYFDLRDRAIRWLGNSTSTRGRNVCVESVENTSEQSLEKLKEDIVSSVLEALKSRNDTVPRRENKNRRLRRGGDERKCWECGSTEHLRYNCTVWKQKQGEPLGSISPLN